MDEQFKYYTDRGFKFEIGNWEVFSVKAFVQDPWTGKYDLIASLGSVEHVFTACDNWLEEE